MPETSNNSRQVELSWAGRVRTGNKQSFDYMKDTEVTFRFKESLLREDIYKEIIKTKWPLTRIVGMVLRPGGLVDFTLKTKDLALSFAKALNELESMRTATAHADTVVEVRIDFIPPGFPSEPITNYLEQNHGELLATPIRISDRFNIQTGTRVFKLEREKLEENPIPSYLFFGRYKFRVRYQGQKTTCGYCAEEDHTERECPKKANMRVFAKTTRLQKRMPKSPTENENFLTLPGPLPTTEEAEKSFERDQPQRKKKRENEDEKTEANKRPLSDSSSSPPNQPQRRKNLVTEKDIASLFDLDPEISTDSSTEFDEIKPYANPCCYELIQKCTGRHFACACEQQYFKCKCGWKNIGKEKGAYQCEQCKDIVANCVSCGSFQIKKKGKLFNCENCHCQLTKELHRSLTF